MCVCVSHECIQLMNYLLYGTVCWLVCLFVHKDWLICYFLILINKMRKETLKSALDVDFVFVVVVDWLKFLFLRSFYQHTILTIQSYKTLCHSMYEYKFSFRFFFCWSMMIFYFFCYFGVFLYTITTHSYTLIIFVLYKFFGNFFFVILSIIFYWVYRMYVIHNNCM